MIDQDTHEEEMKMYGPWPWIVGMAFGAFITFVLFYFADGFA